MDTHVAVVRGAVKAEVNAKGDRAPCRVLCAAVETYLQCMLAIVDRPSWNGGMYFVGGLALQFRKDVLRLRLGSERHLDGLVGMAMKWRIGGQAVVGIFWRRRECPAGRSSCKERTCLARQPEYVSRSACFTSSPIMPTK